MDWLDLFAVQGTLQESSPTPQFKSINSSVLSFLYGPVFTSIHDFWKAISLTIQTFISKGMSLLFNLPSRFVTGFLPRSNCLLTSWLQPRSTVILESKKIKSVTAFIFSISTYHEVMGPDAMILFFLMLSFKLDFSLSSRGSLVPLHFLPLEWYQLHIWGHWYFSWQSLFQLGIHPAWHFCIEVN